MCVRARARARVCVCVCVCVCVWFQDSHRHVYKIILALGAKTCVGHQEEQDEGASGKIMYQPFQRTAARTETIPTCTVRDDCNELPSSQTEPTSLRHLLLEEAERK